MKTVSFGFGTYAVDLGPNSQTCHKIILRSSVNGTLGNKILYFVVRRRFQVAWLDSDSVPLTVDYTSVATTTTTTTATDKIVVIIIILFFLLLFFFFVVVFVYCYYYYYYYYSRDSVPLTYEDKTMVDDTRFSVVRQDNREWNLQIRDIRWSDRGQYRCRVTM